MKVHARLVFSIEFYAAMTNNIFSAFVDVIGQRRRIFRPNSGFYKSLQCGVVIITPSFSQEGANKS